MATVVFFHAHPDDETIGTGGTMAKLASEGNRVVLVTATGGELGEVPDGFLAPSENLAEVRARELAASCRVLGVARQVNLGYRDSGMIGEPGNDDPASFWQADGEEAAARLAEILRHESADAVVFYDENGVYGHPDHIQVHRVGSRAAEIAGTPLVFMATANRDRIRELMASAPALGPDSPQVPPDIGAIGVPAERITTAIDVSGFLATKRAAMRAHASQISETSFFLAPTDEVFAMMWGTEWYIHVGETRGAELEGSLVS